MQDESQENNVPYISEHEDPRKFPMKYCGCGAPVRYLTNDEEGNLIGSCNKYSRCEDYDTIRDLCAKHYENVYNLIRLSKELLSGETDEEPLKELIRKLELKDYPCIIKELKKPNLP